MPVARATAAIPPQPRIWTWLAANRRRARSSRAGRNISYWRRMVSSSVMPQRLLPPPLPKTVYPQLSIFKALILRSPLTVMENLEVGRQRRREGAPHWTPERLFTLFPNLADMRDRPGGQMSGGEQQMLTIARTLMGNPSAILLDEPSEGLAPRITEMMAHAIIGLKAEGQTIVLSEQNLHFAALVSDRAYVIEKGRIRYEGTMAALREDEEVRSTYLSL
jgi:ABC-type branched-subunit amino acid transport system ATPase component